MIKVSSHMEKIIEMIGKKRNLKKEETLLNILLTVYKQEYKKDYLL